MSSSPEFFTVPCLIVGLFSLFSSPRLCSQAPLERRPWSSSVCIVLNQKACAFAPIAPDVASAPSNSAKVLSLYLLVVMIKFTPRSPSRRLPLCSPSSTMLLLARSSSALQAPPSPSHIVAKQSPQFIRIPPLRRRLIKQPLAPSSARVKRLPLKPSLPLFCDHHRKECHSLCLLMGTSPSLDRRSCAPHVAALRSKLRRRGEVEGKRRAAPFLSTATTTGKMSSSLPLRLCLLLSSPSFCSHRPPCFCRSSQFELLSPRKGCSGRREMERWSP